MMVLLEALVTIFCIVSASSKETTKSEHCDVPDKALLEQKLDKIFDLLPEEYVVTNTAGDFLVRGAFFLGNTTIRGLDHLISDRPYKTFCRGDDKITVFTLRAQSALRVSIPWYLCSVYNGTVLSYAGTVRYKGELVTSKSGEGTSSRIENFSTVQLENYSIRMTGSPDALSTAVHIMGHLFSGPIRLYWTEEMNNNVRKALIDALKSSEK
ncbi:unnamed protein product [Ixodes hexagonus]